MVERRRTYRLKVDWNRKGHKNPPEKEIIHTTGYVLIWIPGCGRVSRARLMVEEVLGKKLREGAEVHHVNGNKTDDRNENFVVCNSKSYHQLLHHRTTAYNACGHASWSRCVVCNNWDDPENLIRYRSRWCHPPCREISIQSKKSTGLPRGVSETRFGRYQARIMINYKSKSLGVYETPEEASKVYQAKLKELGERPR